MIRANRLITTILAVFSIFISAEASSVLEDGFAAPPEQARARTWWHWLNGNVTREGIRADLEAMKAVGIQEVQLFNVDAGFPQGPATYMSDEWFGLFRYAAEEASRLGMELAFHNSAGWANSGAPWVTPADAMQKVVCTKTAVAGGRKVHMALEQPEAVRQYYSDIAVVAFPKPEGTQRIADLDYKNLSGRIRNHLCPDTAAVVDAAVVAPGSLLDLSSKMTADGILDWDAPAGDWVVLRIGHTTTGVENHPAPEGGRGLEIDKMNAAVTDKYWQISVQPLLDCLGELAGTTVANCIVDSYESGTCNWTPGFDAEFSRRRGYDFRRFLPTFAGYYVDSPEVTERFLWDYRRTVGDLIADNYYGRFRELCHRHGLKVSVEPYWGPFDSMQVGDRGDLLMCEFWSGLLSAFDSAKFVSSAAHLNGSPIVGAEAFTCYGGWHIYPAMQKVVGDKAWAEGINRFIMHTYAHQPWNVGPGLAMGGYGWDFNRNNTWWRPGKSYLDYIGRAQFLLQQGRNVADVLVFVGEESPNNAFQMPEIKRAGYDYDLIGADQLLALTCRDGYVCGKAGNRYKVLALPDSKWMRPELLAKIESLAEGGAIIVGTIPDRSPSLAGYPACDSEVARIAARLRDRGLVRDITIGRALETTAPDFRSEGKSDISFLHRSTGEGEVYFLADATPVPHVELCTFRVSGLRPELWDARTGKTAEAPVWTDNADGTVTVPVPFDPEGSVFVLFRKPVPAQHMVATEVELKRPAPVMLPDLEILSAEYGTFLPHGLADVTEAVAQRVHDGRLKVGAGSHLSQFDPAPGYIKELRIQYRSNGTVGEISASEGEQIELDVPADFAVLNAVYGKFDLAIRGVPACYPVVDVKDRVAALAAAGEMFIKADETLAGGKHTDGDRNELRVVYSTAGKICSRSVSQGETLSLAVPAASDRLMCENGRETWLTPYPGTIVCRRSDGSTSKKTVKSVPAPLAIDGPWHIDFGGEFAIDTDSLTPWNESADERIRYFSGTATYTTEFTLDDRQTAKNKSLELDLGDVNIMAEVSVNGQPVATLWNAPFTVDLDGAVRKGRNVLEIKITNLWTNRMIGDERYPADYDMNGGSIAAWPAWLTDGTARTGKRSTFATRSYWSTDTPLVRSGLCGPVTVRSYARVNP